MEGTRLCASLVASLYERLGLLELRVYGFIDGRKRAILKFILGRAVTEEQVSLQADFAIGDRIVELFVLLIVLKETIVCNLKTLTRISCWVGI